MLHLALTALLLTLIKATHTITVPPSVLTTPITNGLNITATSGSDSKDCDDNMSDKDKISKLYQYITTVTSTATGRLHQNQLFISDTSYLLSDISLRMSIYMTKSSATANSTDANVTQSMPTSPATVTEMMEWRNQVLDKVSKFLPLAFRYVYICVCIHRYMTYIYIHMYSYTVIILYSFYTQSILIICLFYTCTYVYILSHI